MDSKWTELYNAAKAVQNERKISDMVSAGEVAATVESESGRIYVGVCVDTACTLGICAERNAIFNMLTNDEHEIKRDKTSISHFSGFIVQIYIWKQICDQEVISHVKKQRRT